MSHPSLTEGIPVQRPPHRQAPRSPVMARPMTAWPVGTFVENIAALPDSSFIVSVESMRELQRARPDGSRSVFAPFEASVTGLMVEGNDVFVSTGAIGQADWYRALDRHAGASPLSVPEGKRPSPDRRSYPQHAEIS